MNPFDQAWALLKAPVMPGRAGFPEDDPDYLSPNDQMWNDEADKDLEDKTRALWDYAEAQGIDPALMFDAWHDRASSVEGLDYDGGKPDTGEMKFRAHAVDPSEWKKLASEPMELAFQLLKAADSVGFGETPDYRRAVDHPGQMTLDQFPYEGMADDITHIRAVNPKWFSTMALGGAAPLEQDYENIEFEERVPLRNTERENKIFDKFFFDEEGRKKYMEDKHVPFKRLDTSLPATWWTKPSQENVGRAYIGSPRKLGDRMLVGVRGNVDDMKTQQRDAIEAVEGLPEKMIHDTVPPERLVFMHPSEDDITDAIDTTSSLGNSTLFTTQEMLRNIARRHGFPAGMGAREMGRDEGGIPRYDKDPNTAW